MTTAPRTLFVALNTTLTGQRESCGDAQFAYLACSAHSPLDSHLSEFNSALVNGKIWMHANEQVADSLSFLDYTLLEKILERHLFASMLSEDRRVILVGAINFWLKILRDLDLNLIVHGTYAPHWVWNYSLALAAQLLRIEQFTVCGDVLSYRINLMRLGSNEVFPLSAVKRDYFAIREFCLQQGRRTTHPPYIGSFSKTAFRSFMFGAGVNAGKQAVKNYRNIKSQRSHLQFANYKASPLVQSLAKFAYDVRISAASNALRKRYLRLQTQFKDRASLLRALNEQKVAVYFANLQPEVTTTPDAGQFNNPKLIISELLARGYTVYYKEHPNSFLSSIGALTNQSAIYKGAEFYDQLAAIGVRLLPTNIDNDCVVESGALIVTATGLIALQAACKKARVLMLGRAWYGRPPGVYSSFRQIEQEHQASSVEQIVSYLEERWNYGIPNVVGTMTGKVEGSQEDVDSFFESVARKSVACSS